jgi:hypothetical protein
MNTLYGRKLELKIVLNPKMVKFQTGDTETSDEGEAIIISQDGFTPETLRVTFDIDYPGYKGWYYSEIIIYNFNLPTLMQVVKEGARVYLSAGYKEGNFGEIFSGFVFQSLFERENVTDYKLTLRCVDGAGIFDDNYCSTALEAGHTQTTLMNAIMAYSQTKISTSGGKQIELGQIQFPRAAVIFTTPAEAIRNALKFKSVTEAPNYEYFCTKGNIDMVSITDPPDSNMIVISPGSGGLIGTPVQTEYGANFTCLLNPSIKLANPRKFVKIDMSTIKQLKAVHGQYLSILDQDMELQVIGLKHIGDTRGDDWYTYVTAINKGGKIPAGADESISQRNLPEMMLKKEVDGVGTI